MTGKQILVNLIDETKLHHLIKTEPLSLAADIADEYFILSGIDLTHCLYYRDDYQLSVALEEMIARNGDMTQKEKYFQMLQLVMIQCRMDFQALPLEEQQSFLKHFKK